MVNGRRGGGPGTSWRWTWRRHGQREARANGRLVLCSSGSRAAAADLVRLLGLRRSRWPTCGRCTRASAALELLLDTEEAGDRAEELGAAELAADEARGGEAEKATGSWKKMVAS